MSVRRLVSAVLVLALATVTTLPAVAPAPVSYPEPSATPSPSPSPRPVERPLYDSLPWQTPIPTPVPTPTPSPTPKPTPKPTPRPTPKPTPKPKPKPRRCWPVRGHVSQWFSRRHRAIDIAAPSGSRIVPIRSGRTVFAGWRNNDGGYQVWVYHGRGLYSAYYHMRREVSYRGERVTGCRETIGYVGATGHATGPHLHLEVWLGYPWRSGSRRVNPAKYLP